MTDPVLRPGWYALAALRDLGARPVRRWFDGLPLVLWRTASGVHGLYDVCPHRGARLSHGAVLGGQIVCPYRGWRFDGAGRCSLMPAAGVAQTKPRAAAVTLAVCDDLVFVKSGDEAGQTPAQIPLMSRPFASLLLMGEVATSLADFAENILDTTHTSVVHRGYLRKAGVKRVEALVQTGVDRIEAHLPPEAAPSGFIGRLIGGPRYAITDRFRAPAIAEVEYRTKGEEAFAIRFHLTPAEPGQISAFALMAVPRSPLASLKLLALRAMLARIFRQDRIVLEAVNANRAHFGLTSVHCAPQDLLRAGIEAILRGASLTPGELRQEIYV